MTKYRSDKSSEPRKYVKKLSTDSTNVGQWTTSSLTTPIRCVKIHKCIGVLH